MKNFNAIRKGILSLVVLGLIFTSCSESEDISEYEEGCLSIPEIYEKVTRPAEVKVRFLDRDGEQQERHAEGILATCVQHEIDHLDGRLFVDYLSRLKRHRIHRRAKKTQRQD